jgi:hypothetical protein
MVTAISSRHDPALLQRGDMSVCRAWADSGGVIGVVQGQDLVRRSGL